MTKFHPRKVKIPLYKEQTFPLHKCFKDVVLTYEIQKMNMKVVFWELIQRKNFRSNISRDTSIYGNGAHWGPSSTEHLLQEPIK